eukprot:scaffold4300_cov81-Isochrysis_galbana.AAC.2
MERLRLAAGHGGRAAGGLWFDADSAHSGLLGRAMLGRRGMLRATRAFVCEGCAGGGLGARCAPG